jgi:hypothetical protein
VTWTEPTEVGALRDALAFHDMRSVMLISPLLAAAALTQTVGDAMNYQYTALLFVEPETATLAVIATADGSIVDLHRRRVNCAGRSREAASEMAAMVAALDELESRPDGVFVVGCGVDIAPVKSHLAATVSIPVNAPEEPDMALARGAAVASANAPLFTSSTAALAYAQDPGTGEVNPDVLAPAHLDVSVDGGSVGSAVAYSALVDDEVDEGPRLLGPFLLAGSGAAAAIVIGIATLVISLVAGAEPMAGQRISPHRNTTPTKQVAPPPGAHAPAAAAPGSSVPQAAPRPSGGPSPSAAPPPPPAVAVPTPVVQQLPQRAVTPNPYRAPTRQAPVYVPPPAADQAPPPAAPPPSAAPPPAPPPPAAPPPAPAEPRLPPMVMYLHLPFVTVPIPINPPPPPPGP